jgi:RNA polymerase sigma factor (sigma-70 family)
MTTKIIPHSQLDALLDPLAAQPETFAKKARLLARKFDRNGWNLEIRDPQRWRKPVAVPTARHTLEQQLRAEIDSFRIMEREEEAQLARRIEFSRLRLELALKEAGLQLEDLDGGTPEQAASLPGMHGRSRKDCQSFPRACRRWTEWHALRTELVERNLYLVLINVERYAHTTAGRADLIQEGAAALYRAVDGFDWKRGLLFRTYAVHWLNQAFRAYIYNFTSTVRVPVYLQKAMRHVHQAIVRLGDPNASPAEIARVSGLGENLVVSALDAMRSTRSIDAPLSGEEDASGLRELLQTQEEGPYSTELEDVSLARGLGEALERLSERERSVIALRFGLQGQREHTLSEVADHMGVSLERVRQIQMRAITKLRTPGLRKVVDPYLNN